MTGSPLSSSPTHMLAGWQERGSLECAPALPPPAIPHAPLPRLPLTMTLVLSSAA